MNFAGCCLPPEATPTEDDAVAVLLCTLLCDLESATDREHARAESYARGSVRSRHRTDLPSRLGNLTQTECKCIFRMTASAMEDLRNQLFPFLRVQLPDNVIVGRAAGNRRPISVDEKICVGLLIMGGGTIGPMIWGNHISKSSVYNVFEEFVCAVISSNIGAIHFPATLEEMEETSEGFLQSRLILPIFFGCIGAVDGYALRIYMPGKNQVGNAVAYKNRKAFCSINLQAVANSRLKCTYLSVETPGGTHDSTAWQVSSLGSKMDRENWTNPSTRRPYWLACDDAYGASSNLVCPWPGTGLRKRDPFKDGFNYYLSGGIRNTVERMFGLVYQRWGILWRPMRYKISKIPLIVQAIFQLHNFLIDQKEEDVGGRALGSIRNGKKRLDQTHPLGFEDNPVAQDEVADELVVSERVRNKDCPTRYAITEHLRANFITRPDDGVIT